MFTEIRTYPLEIRELSDEGMFSGHASVFDVIDSYGTIFDKGVFKRTIKSHKGAFPLSVNHDWWVPIGMARGVKEDDTGLLIEEGHLNVETTRANDVYLGLPHPDNKASGYYSDMSHGFSTIREQDDKDGVAHKKEVNLFELAIVTQNFGSNPEAGVEQVRMATRTLREVNSALKKGNEQRFVKEVFKLRKILEVCQIPTLGEEGETASALLQAEGPSLDTRKLQDSVSYLQKVVKDVAKRDHLQALHEQTARLNKILKG